MLRRPRSGRSPFLVSCSENRQIALVVACPAWESGKPDFGFPLFHPGHARLWECGNLAPWARFPRGRGKRGKAAFAFPRFPWTRHFHSPPPATSVRSPSVRRFALAAPQQYPSGRRQLPRPFGVAHFLRHRVQSRKAHPLLQVFLRLRQALPLLVWRRIVCLFVLPLPFAARVQAHRRESTRTMKVQVWV